MMTGVPATAAYIDLGVLESNYRLIKAKLSAKTGILGIVKADAYGHGAVKVSRRLEEIGIRYLGVATLEEAIELREEKLKSPILVLSGLMPWEEVEPFLHLNLTVVVHDFVTLREIRKHVGGTSTHLKIHVKFDTGMGRLGFQEKDVPEVIEEIRQTRQIDVEGVMSHFASSEARNDRGLEQIKSFERIVQAFRKEGIEPGLVHMGNSGAIIRYPEAHFDLVRVGISLYGSHPSRDLKKELPTRQVMKLASRIAFIREFPAGSALSYGGTFTTVRQTRVAYIPVGYGDGFCRALSNKGHILIKNRRCPIIGRICMDWILADITDAENVAAQEEVVLLGRGQEDAITADEIAEIAGTIPYEILCNISKRVQRIHV